MTFKIVTKAKGWKAVTSALLSINEEALLQLKDDGIHTNTLDPSTKEVLKFLWLKEKFSVYDVAFLGNESVDLNISVRNIFTICKRFDDDADLTIESKDNGLLITDNKKEFVCSVLAVIKEPAKPLNVPYVGEVEFDIQQLLDMRDDSLVFGIDSAWFTNEGGKLVFRGKDIEGNVKGVLLESFEGVIENTGYNFGYLGPFLQAVKGFVEPKVKAQLGSGFPLHLVLTIPDVTILHFNLAPMRNN